MVCTNVRASAALRMLVFPTFTTSIHVHSSGVCTKQPACDYSEDLPPDIPPGTTRCRDSPGFLPSRSRRRLAHGLPSDAHEGVEDAREPGEDHKQEAREASLALADLPLPLKRWVVEIKALCPARAVFLTGMEVGEICRALLFSLTAADILSDMNWGHSYLPDLSSAHWVKVVMYYSPCPGAATRNRDTAMKRHSGVGSTWSLAQN